ncbi:iron ABC transporter substrate-binding protein [Allofranklinella schreckenbergeri]|uniref:Iron ABC transporter substrate-binding protein n=1 Tax=Allofranklinella schreckenbergeri TaxID=1076744 RepID=A0A3M6R5H6_9BURK|nr:MetQ/NlpA family ABC transporter substrate-binding protein [Allofranklinella schreckenbergeri]RMX10527.1 iron ABC transporter substrate-binding protein [Allofranklinella schreckenbergeri]
MLPSRPLSHLCRLALIGCTFALGAAQAAGESKPLKVGVIPVVANAATEIAIQQAKAQGLEVQLVEFSDWVLPNTAVADGAVDVNFFQHAPFLQLFNQKQNAQLTPIAYGYSTTMGLYSKKLKKGDAVPEGASIAIPSDPVNAARALLLLQSAGLITLKPGVTTQAKLEDITANPKNIRIVPIEGAHAARSFDDVTASVTYATFAKQAGIAETDGLFFDNTDAENLRRYAIRWVTKPERAQDPRILQFIEIYQQSPEVRATLRKHYGELIDFPWLQK